MSSWATTAMAFGIISGAVGLGLLLRQRLACHHLDADSRDVLKLVLGIIATMSALVLSLLIASAKTAYDTQQSELFDVTAKMVELDRVLGHYGSGADRARLLLRQAVSAELDRVEPLLGREASILPVGSARARIEAFYDSIQQLVPETNAQRFAQARALQISGSIA